MEQIQPRTRASSHGRCSTALQAHIRAPAHTLDDSRIPKLSLHQPLSPCNAHTFCEVFLLHNQPLGSCNARACEVFLHNQPLSSCNAHTCDDQPLSSHKAHTHTHNHAHLRIHFNALPPAVATRSSGVGLRARPHLVVLRFLSRLGSRGGSGQPRTHDGFRR